MSATVTPLFDRRAAEAPESLREAVARNVGAILGENSVSKARLARAIGLSAPGLTMKLNGRRPLDLEDLEAIAAALDVEPADLVARRSPRPAGPAGASTSLSQRARPEGLEPPTFCSGASEGHTCDDTCRKVIVLPVPDPRDLDDVDDVEGWLAPVTALPTAVAR